MRWPASVGLDVKKLPLISILVPIKEAKKGCLLVPQTGFFFGPESFHSPVIPLNLLITEKPLKSDQILSFWLNSQFAQKSILNFLPSLERGQPYLSLCSFHHPFLLTSALM